MRAVVQRVLSASVTVDGKDVGSIEGPGLLVLLGVTHADGPAEVAWMARKVWELRIMRDEKSASDLGAPVLVVSQFTLYGDARKGRRPTWIAAAPGPVSEPLYLAFCTALREPRGDRRRGELRRGHAGGLGERRPGHDDPRDALTKSRTLVGTSTSGFQPTALSSRLLSPTISRGSPGRIRPSSTSTCTLADAATRARAARAAPARTRTARSRR